MKNPPDPGLSSVALTQNSNNIVTNDPVRELPRFQRRGLAGWWRTVQRAQTHGGQWGDGGGKVGGGGGAAGISADFGCVVVMDHYHTRSSG